MRSPLHLVVVLRNLGARELRALERVEVVGFGRDEVEALGALDCGDDGLFRGAVTVDARRSSALALRLAFGPDRSRLSPAAPLCESRCAGVVVVDVNAMTNQTRWEFGPADFRALTPDPALVSQWHTEAARLGIAAATDRPESPAPMAKVPASGGAERAGVLASLRPLAAVARLLGGAA